MHYIWSYKCSESVKSLANRDSSSWCDDKRSYEVRDVGTMCCCVGPSFGGESEGPMSMKGGLRSEVKGRLWNTNCPFNVLILIWDKFDSNRVILFQRLRWFWRPTTLRMLEKMDLMLKQIGPTWVVNDIKGINLLKRRFAFKIDPRKIP